MSSFSLLLQVAQGSEHADIWSAEESIAGWLAFERALALAQADEGVITSDDAVAIAAAATREAIDADELWTTARLVGYPILGLARQVAAATPGDAAGRVHYGATTQDVMDTAAALQMQRSLAALDRGLAALGDRVARSVAEHATTVMPARTHAQHAVPTTFGATLATLLEQLARHRARIADARERIEVVSLYGAGGTSAAYGPTAPAVRRGVAARLGLGVRDVPWHVDRDGPAEFGWLCATIAATCAKIARNVVDLSRTEIGEVSEPYSRHRGASSTMPQKVNAISSEIIIGLAASAGALTSALPRVQEAGHERAAGEWHIEWHVLPQLADLAGRALREATELVDGLRVDAERMRANLALDGGLIMAESTMIRLADSVGQATAHDLVYSAAQRVRVQGLALHDAVIVEASQTGVEVPALDADPQSYLGEAVEVCRLAGAHWRDLPAPEPQPADLREIARVSPDEPRRHRAGRS
jgi:3-carboxy-cis,cis-muconate cycloisomerase